MDNQIEVAARKVVDAMVEASNLFTAFDVTTLLRTKGHNVQHYGINGVRAFVSNLFDNGDPVLVGYARNLHVIGNDISVLVYHPFNSDVNDYDPDKFVNEDSKQAFSDLPPQVAGDDNATVDDGKIGVDKRGRLCVRAKLLRRLGVGPGDRVYVFVANADKTAPNEIRIVHATGANVSAIGFVYKDYLVDRDNCLRLSSRTLRKAFDGWVSQFGMDYENGSSGTYLKVEV